MMSAPNKIIDLNAEEAANAQEPSSKPQPIWPSKSSDYADSDKPQFRDPVAETAQRFDALSRKIEHHESIHASAIRDVLPGTHPDLTHAVGPDGRRYIVAGEVHADLRPVPGRPKATEAKAEAIYRSALADQQRSPEDEAVSRAALELAQEARRTRLAWTHERPVNSSPDNSPAPMPSPANASPDTMVMRNPALFAVGARVLGAVATRAAPVGVRFAAQEVPAAMSRQVAHLADRSAAFARAGNTTAANDYAMRSIQLDQAIPKISAMADNAMLASGAMKLLSSTTAGVTKVFTDLNQSASDRLANFSPDISIQNSLNLINRMNQNWRQAAEIGGILSNFEKQQGRLDIAGKDVQGELIRIFGPMVNQLVSNTANLLEHAAAWSKWAADQMDKMPDWMRDMLENVAVGAVAGPIGLLGKILGAVEPKNQGNGGLDRLQDFFNMKVPPPKEPARLNGPVIAMAMPQLKPPGGP